MTRRRARTLVLDIATLGLVVVAAGTLVHDRLLPALAERDRLDPGDRVTSSLEFRPLGGGPAVDVAAAEPTLVVVFRSSCPICEETAPDWKELARLAPGRVLAVGLESDSAASAWVADHVPGVRPVVPRDPAGFLDRLRIRAVPFTLLFENGRLAMARVGPLTPADRDRIRDAFRATAHQPFQRRARVEFVRTRSPEARRIP